MGHLRLIMQVLKEHQLFGKFSKCEFWLRSIAFLGHVFSSEGIEVDPKKMKAVKNWHRGITPTDIRSLLGLAEFYRRFVEGVASVDSPLTLLTQKKVMFERSKAFERGFQELKDRFTAAPMFTLPEGTKGFVVYCDALE